ncbi:protein PHYTOCHROME KINASE SUBSTRATE 4 [Phragmites australis]|uniref:protein PHYTOCHROME KINASE SUBSTRATE 4 n=1 Tax=Phragmites australis TaxID=29695 RepID=UPI002D766757|nr:protein PHYTOCHROME KINASE SUBSTRATE 4 [Phragmites australis]
MDRYRVAPARPACQFSAGPGGHLRPAAPCGAAGRRSGGAEIGIFTAERYFSAADVVRRDAIRPALPEDEPPRLSVPPRDVASQSGRTAASSEASWNSRSGLLSSGRSAAARQKWSGGAVNGSDQGYRGKKPGSSGRWTLFGRDCPCAGRKAVTVDVASEPRSPTIAPMHARFSAHSAVEECLESMIFKAKDASPPGTASDEPAKVKVTVTPGSRAFPLAADNVFAVAAPPNRGTDVPSNAFASGIGRRVVSSTGFTFPALGSARFTSNTLDEPPRVSLEVFRPIDENSVMLADPPPAMAGRGGVHVRPPPMAALVDEDAMSDASSELFDLESFAASSSYPTTYRGRGSRRNSADDDLPYAAAAEPALSECMYAPSEASVVWSVATAEGGAFDAASVANFSSAASACCVDEFRYIVPESPAGFTAAMSRSAGRKKGGGGFLNSCRCEKAVSVGPTPVRVVKPPAYPAAASKTGGGARCRPDRVHVPVRT